MQKDARKAECPDEQVLGKYVAGQLEEPQLGDCESHLAECDQCEETIRGLLSADTANDSFDQLALEALRDGDDSESTDAPLVDQLIRDLARQSLDPDSAFRALENRAAEVTGLLPKSETDGFIGRIAGYEITRLLGAGSTGIVYEADDAGLHRKVALKILRPSLGDAARERFMNEARAAAAISHPNVVTIYQVGVEGPLAFIAMELTDGQTLESRLIEVAFIPEAQIRSIATQVAQGLAAAHRNGLIHRDIKPANVWLKSENDQAVILDFGLARIADDDPQMTATGMLAGTPNFMSPEQTRGLELDGRSDLFSLGCLMYRASTGKLPFGSTGILATLQAIQHEEPRPPLLMNPHVSQDFSDLVMALLEKQPANRPDSADQLVGALQSERSKWPFPVSSYSERGSDASSTPATATSSARTGGFSGRRWFTIALFAVLLGVGTLGWFFTPQIIRIATDQGELVIDANGEAVVVEVLRGGKVTRIVDTETEQSINIDSGEYRTQVKDKQSGKLLSTRRIFLTRGGRAIVSVSNVHLKLPNSGNRSDATSEKISEDEVLVKNNLKQIVSGWLIYEADSKNHRLPNIGNRDSNGNLLLSWRVHILPYIGHQELYSKFHLYEPWDSQHNQTLLKQMPADYSDPTDENLSAAGKTRILAPMGDGLILDPDSENVCEGTGFVNITDGSANTIAVIQVGKQLAVEWTRPQDWSYDGAGANSDLANANERTWYASCDGAVHNLILPVSNEFVWALTTREGRETVDLENQTFTSPLAQAGMDMGMGMGMGMDMGMEEPKLTEPLYAGKTFDQWMQVVKNDRQLQTKFNALAAVAELAQGDDGREKQVMDQIKPLLRKYGSKEMEGGDPFQNESNGGTLKNNFRNGELTHLFIEIFRRFSDDDLMELAIDEIKNGTANSREFLVWVWLAYKIRGNDRTAQLDFQREIDRHSVEIATAVLETAKSCDSKSLGAMSVTINVVNRVVSMDLTAGENESGISSDQSKRVVTERRKEWRLLLTNAFDSGDPTQQGCVAITMAETLPDHTNLASDLMELLANENMPTEIRVTALRALEELPLEKVEPVADRLLSAGKQTGPMKDLLNKLTKSRIYYVRNENGCGYGMNHQYGIDANTRIAYILSHLKNPGDDLVRWLEDLATNAKPETYTYPNGNGGLTYNTNILKRAVQRAKGEPLEELKTSPGGGVF